jgi:hypothetical protein
MKYALLLLLLFSTVAEAQWFKSRPDYRPSVIHLIEAENIQQKCIPERGWSRGCVLRTPEMAIIYYPARMSQQEWEGIMIHEILCHVIRGLDHELGNSDSGC